MTPYWRRIFILLLSLLIVLTLFGFSGAPSTITDRAFNMPSPADLRIVLTKVSDEPVTIRASVQNAGPAVLTVLPWDTPLDPMARQLGVFEITDLESGEQVQFPRIMINRKLPVERSELVQIDPGNESSKELSLEGPLSPLRQGKRYSVRAAGHWRAVWVAPVGEIQDDDLRKIEAADASMGGEFASEAIEV